MSIINKLRKKLIYRNKLITDDAPSWVRVQLRSRPQMDWSIEVPAPNGDIHVYEIQVDTISTNLIYSNWELVANYKFTYHPSRRQYNKLINYQKETL